MKVSKYHRSRYTNKSYQILYFNVSNVVNKTLKIKKPDVDIAQVLTNISEEFDSIDIGSYPFYKPPDIGTNIVFRSKDLTLIKKAVVEICIVFKKDKDQCYL